MVVFLSGLYLLCIRQLHFDMMNWDRFIFFSTLIIWIVLCLLIFTCNIRMIPSSVGWAGNTIEFASAKLPALQPVRTCGKASIKNSTIWFALKPTGKKSVCYLYADSVLHRTFFHVFLCCAALSISVLFGKDPNYSVRVHRCEGVFVASSTEGSSQRQRV